MSNKCTGIPRFTHPGTNLDRWYCIGCGAVMFLPHGEPAPDEHDRGRDIMPNHIVRDMIKPIESNPGPSQGTALERYTGSLPGDMSIIKKDK